MELDCTEPLCVRLRELSKCEKTDLHASSISVCYVDSPVFSTDFVLHCTVLARHLTDKHRHKGENRTYDSRKKKLKILFKVRE